MSKTPCVYMVASKPDGVLYIGVTSNLQKRVWEHKNNVVQGFTQKYNVHTLVYYQVHETMEAAITHEKQLKKWDREWKVRIIEELNSAWGDLYDSL